MQAWSMRRGITSPFYSTKWSDVPNNLWQQKRTVLELWMQICSTAWILVRLLNRFAEKSFSVYVYVVARQTTTDRWYGGAVATHGIYRTCFQGGFEPEVLNTRFPQTAWRSKIAGVAASALPILGSPIGRYKDESWISKVEIQ